MNPKYSFNPINVTWFSLISHCSDRENLADTSVHPEPDRPSNNHTTPSVTPDPQSTLNTSTSSPLEEDTSEILGPDYHLLSRRERTQAELLVETLARELVSHDKSLTALLDTWAGKSTLDLMEDIFPSHSSSPRRRSSGHVGHRWALHRWWRYSLYTALPNNRVDFMRTGLINTRALCLKLIILVLGLILLR